jgi:hypothetical protein
MPVFGREKEKRRKGKEERKMRKKFGKSFWMTEGRFFRTAEGDSRGGFQGL